jgi:hypothetical protein
MLPRAVIRSRSAATNERGDCAQKAKTARNAMRLLGTEASYHTHRTDRDSAIPASTNQKRAMARMSCRA